MHIVPLPAITDPDSPSEPNGFERIVDRVTLPLLVDPRDVVFTRNAAGIAATVLPGAALVYLLPPLASFLVGFLYVPFVMVRWAGPFVLMVHAVTHRPLFRKRYRLADKFITFVLAPFFGIPPTAYHPHHVVMHHKENNGADDLSATLGYQRDRFLDFAHYWARFVFFGHLHLASWLVRRGRWSSLGRFVVGELAYLGGVVALLAVDPMATVVVFVIPFALLRFFMMAGNWSQHAFVDVQDPTNAYTNSSSLLNTIYNVRCYNDGYHVVHHRKPGLHWAEMPAAFLADLPAYAAHDSIVFHGVVNNQQVWWALMRGDYGFLADCLVDLGDRKRTREEKIAFLQSRVRPLGETRRGFLEFREAS
ncbi:MAG: fatty acid desaturase [Deltaproteobacteria bacterium]|nr:fatty acid desaturase [Deltaproteobacteria bacterium]